MSNGLNLNAARRARAARRGRKDGPIPLYFGEAPDGSDKLIAMLPSGFPLHALEPFTRLDVDMGFLLHVLEQVMKSDNRATDAEAIGMVIGLLSKTPDLPSQLVRAAREVAQEVLGQEGYERFMAERPAVEDIVDLVKSLSAEWGVGRGESTPPESGSPSGGPSTPTSETPTVSTSTESGTTPEIPASSESTSSSTSATDSLTMPE
ncbi:hypothetical protein [Streptosporangium sp. NPDC048865]|uniref:hypothetical protein n=1 Tax=Streptosporangium sp. NPDC048865 TaxID=3155766 RepID=UPI0034164496